MKKKISLMALTSLVMVSNVLADNGIGTREDNGIGTIISTVVDAVLSCFNGIGT